MPFVKGYIMSETHKERIRDANKGDKNYLWHGENVGYRGLHRWVERELGKPSTCVNCNKSNLFGRFIHWANISGEYKRSLDDWIRLCASCHKNYDNGKLELVCQMN